MYKKKFIPKDGTEVLFREPKANDAKQLMKMINEMARERRSGISAIEPITLKKEKEWLSGVLKGIKKNVKVMLVVEINGKIRGNCSIERKTNVTKHRAYIGITLNKEIRSKGIGTALMTQVIELAKKRMKKLEIIELDVLDFNKRAQGLYKKLGFKRITKIPKFAKYRKEHIDAYLMHLYL